MFHLEPEGCYRCTKSVVRAPFWFLTPFWLSADEIWIWFWDIGLLSLKFPVGCSQCLGAILHWNVLHEIHNFATFSSLVIIQKGMTFILLSCSVLCEGNIEHSQLGWFLGWFIPFFFLIDEKNVICHTGVTEILHVMYLFLSILRNGVFLKTTADILLYRSTVGWSWNKASFHMFVLQNVITWGWEGPKCLVRNRPYKH